MPRAACVADRELACPPTPCRRDLPAVAGKTTCLMKTSSSRAGPSSRVIHFNSLLIMADCGSSSMPPNSDIAARNRRRPIPGLVQALRLTVPG